MCDSVISYSCKDTGDGTLHSHASQRVNWFLKIKQRAYCVFAALCPFAAKKSGITPSVLKHRATVQYLLGRRVWLEAGVWAHERPQPLRVRVVPPP